MNDYKKLVERLNFYSTSYAVGVNLGREIEGTGKLMSNAADAIETLIAERDAAIVCLEAIATKTGDGCEYCVKCPTCKRCTGFEWAGVQKECVKDVQ